MVTGKLYIDGRWEDGEGKRFQQRNPARLSEITGTWPLATDAEVDRAIQAASRAFDSWRKTPPVKRADLFKAVLAGIQERTEELALALTRENGKTLAESRAEIQSGFREMEYQVQEGMRQIGQTSPSIREGITTYNVRRPLGVVSVISPWNFPFNVPCRKITPALMAGNTVVFKPASLTPFTGQLFVDLFDKAGFPPGVINFVPGSGSTVGNRLSTDPRIRAVSFTGSTDVGRKLHETAATAMIKTQLEMGGKNAMVILDDADLDAATDAAVTAAFTCAGQWCTATSRLIVERGVAAEMTDRLAARVANFRLGDGVDSATTMGPVCGSEQVESILRRIEEGKAEGARLAAGGSRATASGLEDGCFIEPTLFAGVTPSMTIAQEEIFGPVLSIIEAADLDDAIAKANDSRYGLTSSIYTRDFGRAMRFVEAVETGFTHVNLMTAYREPQHPFGGIKMSGFGLPEAGSTGIEFFTEHKVAYLSHA